MILRDKLRGALSVVPKTVAETNQSWTVAVKTSLCVLGKDEKYYVSSSDVMRESARNGEWLFDVTWSHYDGLDNDLRTDWRLKSLQLIVESEWGNDGDLLDDFEKLLVARAKEKLMIIDASTDVEYEKRKALLSSAKDAFGESVHDRIYLACFVKSDAGEYGWELKFDDL